MLLGHEKRGRLKMRKYLLGLAVIIVLAAYQLREVPLFKIFDEIERDIFAILLSLAALIIAIDYYLQNKINFIRIFAISLATYNLLNELFGDPYEYSLLKYSIGTTIAIGCYAFFAIRAFDLPYYKK